MPTQAEIGILFKGDAADFKRASQSVRDESQKLRSDMGGLAGDLKKVAAAYLSVQTAQQALNSMRLGENFQLARAAFQKWVSDAEAGLAQMRAATKGTVDDLTLFQRANEAFNKGVNFQQFVTALEYADLVADQGGRNFEEVLNRVTTALGRSEAGAIQNRAALVALGITVTDTNGILGQMQSKIDSLNTQYDAGSEAVARYDANMKNLQTSVGVLLKDFLGPLVEKLSLIANYFSGGSISEITDALVKLNSSSFLSALFGDEGVENARNTATQVVDQLTRKMVAGTATTEDFSSAAEALRANLEDISDPDISANLQNLIDIIEQAREAASKAVSGGGSGLFGPTEADAQANQELLEKIAQQNKTAAEEADRIRAESIAQDREEMKIKISLGQATYQDLSDLLKKQEQENQDFFNRNRTARLAWLADTVAVHQQEVRESDNKEAQKYNTTRRYIEYLLQDSTRSKEQRIRDAIEVIDYTLQYEKLDIEHRRQLYSQRQQLEQEFTNFVQQKYQEQIQFLQNTFGTTALQIMDDFFSGAERRFEDYLKNLLRMIARAALQSALTRLFGGLLGLFGGGIPAISSGSGNFDFGTTSIPRMDPNQILRNGLATLDSFRQVSPAFNPQFNPQIQVAPAAVQVILDEYGLYLANQRGKQKYDRSSLTSD